MNTFSIFMQIVSFIASNKDMLKTLVLDLENLIPDAPGNAKAAAVRAAIGTAIGIENQIEAVWPMIAPIFNLFVGAIKGPKAP